MLSLLLLSGRKGSSPNTVKYIQNQILTFKYLFAGKTDVKTFFLQKNVCFLVRNLILLLQAAVRNTTGPANHHPTDMTFHS